MADSLQELVDDARARTRALVDDLTDEQMEFPYSPVLNPFRWELGHIAFFFDAMVLHELGRPRFLRDGAETLYDSFEVAHADRWDLPVPDRAGTLDYMERVRAAVVDEIARRDDDWSRYVTTLAVLHEDMHGEAFHSMRQTLGYAAPPIATEGVRRAGPHPGDAAIPGGAHLLGAARDTPFVFDNEKWAHRVDVAPFSIAKAATTNAEFAAFVDDGGYRREQHWSPAGWVWRSKTDAGHPLYWQRDGGAWMRRHFDRVVPLEPDAAVCCVSWYEAEAYCAWANRRLPSEAEWDVAASAEPTPDGSALSGDKRRYPWGDDPPTADRANLDSRTGDVADVGAHPAGDSAFGCRQMLGNVWEWTADPHYPFPGYVVDRPYREYSAPWFGYEKVLKGGAWPTRARLANNVYRNFFRPDRRDVYAGFRTCAK